MPAKTITDAFVRNVKPPRADGKHKQITYIDTLERGVALMLIVSYGGTKAFRAMTYVNGKPKSVKLGIYPQMKVKEARAKTKNYWQNPEKFTAQAVTGSFKDIADNWIKRHVEAHKLRSQKEIKRHLETYVFPKWRDRKFLEIRRKDVNELLDHIADNNGRSQADAVLTTLSSIMTWHQSRDENYVSPIVKGMKRNRPTARKRILNDNEIRNVWDVANDFGTFGAIIKILLLTAQRREKVKTMRWTDIVDGEWVIQTEAREKGTATSLKLPQMALDVLANQPRIAGNNFIFAGRGKTAFNAFSQRKAELDAKLVDMETWVIHDLRRTARSLLSRAGVRPDISERVLGHAIAGVEGVYDRHQYDAEKADALYKLARLIDTIINPPEGNVVALIDATKRDRKGVA